jgi:hypothetical protein
MMMAAQFANREDSMSNCPTLITVWRRRCFSTSRRNAVAPLDVV